MADDLKLDSVDDVLAALAKLAADVRSLAADMHRAADAAAKVDQPTFRYFSRMRQNIVDASHQMVPPAAVQRGSA